MNKNSILGVIVAGYLSVTAGFIINSEMTHNKPVTNTVQKAVSKPLNLVWIDPPESTVNSDELRCMATNMFFEARNQKTDTAFAAVGYTVLNRVKNKHYPNAICDVVYQRKQFSWTHDKKSDTPNLKNKLEKAAWVRSEIIAMKVMMGTIDNPIGSATMYHANYVSPYWKNTYKRIAKIEDHIFYAQI